MKIRQQKSGRYYWEHEFNGCGYRDLVIGKLAQVSFKDPEKIIIVETIENLPEVGFVTKEVLIRS